MKKTLLISLMIGLISCNSKSQENNANDQHCFEYKDNFYSRVSKENIEEIISEYTKVDFKDVLSFSIVKSQGKKPSIFLIYYKNSKLNFACIESNENKWCAVWSNELDEDMSYYFKQSDLKLELKNNENEIDSSNVETITFKGCRPNTFCHDKGFAYYNVKDHNGYVAIYSTDKDVKNHFPFDLPKKYSILKDFESNIMLNIKDDDSFQILAELPKERIIPVYGCEYFPKFIDTLLNKYDENVYDMYSLFTLDFNSDKKNDFIYRVVQKDFPYDKNKMKNGYYLFYNGQEKYLYSGCSEEDIENMNDFYFPSNEIIYYVDKSNNNEYLVITEVPKGSFNVNSSKQLRIFKKDGDSFTYLKDDKNIKKEIIKYFDLNSPEYFEE